MLKIGLTGGIGSGKSTVAAMFEKKGILVIDADLIAREVLEPGQPAYEMMIQHFGKSILDDSQKHIHRQKLRNIIFSDPSEKIWLEQLLHPIILELMKVRAELAVSPYCILMIPLLK